MAAGLARQVDNSRFGRCCRNLDGALIGVALDKHTRGGVTGLARIREAEARPARHGGVDIGIVEHKVRRLAAKLQRHGFDSVGGRLADQDAGTGRTGERHHIDIGMRGQDRADPRAVAIDHVEDTGGNTGLMHDFGKQDAGHRGDFRRFQHHRASGRQRRADLQHNLVHRPVPGGDQAGDTRRLEHQILTFRAGAHRALPLKRIERADERFQMAAAGTCLVAERHVDRRAHFRRDRLGHVGRTRLIDRENGAKHLAALRRGRHRPGRECPTRCRDCRLGIGGPA